MSSMFAHVEVYARKRSASRRSVSEVLAEARRDHGACSHVENPRPPIVVRGMGIDAVEKVHDQTAADGIVWTESGVTRRLRSDTPTLYASVFSHPLAYADFSSKEDGIRVKSWIKDTVDWAQADLEARGGVFLSAIVHADEKFPHIHIYGVHSSGRAEILHPGRAAKRKVVARMEAAGATKQQANRGGNNTYRQTMRSWQDRYWSDCAAKHALDRTGPKRARLTRKEWSEARAGAELLAERIRSAEELQATARQQLQILDAAAKRMGVDVRALINETVEAQS